MRTRTAAITAAVLLATLAACSSSDDSTNTEQKPTDTAPLEQAVEDYTAALFSGDANGYSLVSARCKKQMPETEWVEMAETAHQQYGAQKATNVKVDQMSGDLARVSYGAGNIPQFNRESQSWTREDGTWRWDACPSTN